MPAVSVVMLFHRIQPFLLPAVRSVLDQRHADFEFILVDNGAGVEAAYFGDDPRLRLLRLPQNRGIAGGHNAAVAAARGEFIALLDYDDLALPDRIATQVAALQADPNLDLVCGLAEGIDASGRRLGREFTLADSAAQFAFTAYSVPSITPTWLGRAELFRRFPFREEFGAAPDFDFLSRALEKSRMGLAPAIVTQYRHHDAQTTWQGAMQVINACCIRRLTMRRRSGRNEDFVSLTTEMSRWLGEGIDAATAYRRTAEACLQEGFGLQAVFHARRHIGCCRRPGAFFWGLRLLTAAQAATKGREARLATMFFGGPLRYHRLRRA
jgi:glycosyltransferase involved in cell wall biosynthesis